LSRSADVDYASKHVDEFCSRVGVAVPRLPWPPMPPIDTDPPLHGQYRRILNHWFSPGQAKAMEPSIRAHAVDLLGQFEGRDTFDYADEFAKLLPQRTTLELLKLPTEDADDLEKWTWDIMRHRSEPEIYGPSAQALLAYLAETVAQRKAAPLEGDIISELVVGQVDGQQISDEQAVLTLVLLVIAGLDTTAMAIGVAAWYLALHPELRDRLRSEPALMDSAVEEFLRWISPVPFQGRTVAKDLEFGGCPMKQGQTAALLLGSANRDAAAFPDPDEFVPDRYPNRHVAFGVGAHRCLGSNIARISLRVSIEELLTRIPEFHIADPDGLVWFTSEVRGLHHLPLAPGRK
jgi:cytochrome P450